MTNLVTGTIQATPRKIVGYQCEPADARVQLSDGSTAIFQLWRATDLKGLPIQISSGSPQPALTLSLLKIRLEPPPAELFAVPDGFTKYNTPDNLADELAIRLNNMHRQPKEPTETPGPPGSPGQHQRPGS